ncbi:MULTISPECIES: histidine kinase [Bacteroides]|uniref:histidine kinase n=1 Tax=Bacteroides TaxID=816 RepID=UPI00221FFD3B|nr:MULTISPECIES: histidine kinase [Bacteroides]MCS2959662.1 histidine kinase [Bacteroides salyersiae]UYU44080.1 histidine kinase [Bacteroides salyersiae]
MQLKRTCWQKSNLNACQYLLTTHDRQAVTLQEELQFVDSYLYLEQIKFEDTLQILLKMMAKNRVKLLFRQVCKCW